MLTFQNEEDQSIQNFKIFLRPGGQRTSISISISISSSDSTSRGNIDRACLPTIYRLAAAK